MTIQDYYTRLADVVREYQAALAEDRLTQVIVGDLIRAADDVDIIERNVAGVAP
jgi:hypothetical protein